MYPPQLIDTRVCIDEFGPFECKLDLRNRWNGWLSPHFSLDVARDVSARTLQTADECGYDSVDTIHIIDGRADSPDTVHIIDGVPGGYLKDPIAVAVRIPWRGLDRGATAALSRATPQARKAARRTRAGGRGAARSVAVHVRWQYMDEGPDVAASVITRDSFGLFPIGGWEWTWHEATWWCACGAGNDWHETQCEGCPRARDGQPKDGDDERERQAAAT